MPDQSRQMPKAKTMRPKRTLSVRVRLMIVAIIAIVPLIAERIHNEEIDRGDRIEAAQKRVLDVARQGAAEQNKVIVSTRSLLQVIATAHSQFKFSDAECSQFLAAIAAPSSGIKTLSISSVLGKIVCSSAPEALGLDISERAHFTRAIDTAGFVLSDYFSGTRVHGPLITLALAERGENGAAASVVLGLLDLSWFEKVARTLVPLSGCMLMVDGKGVILARYPAAKNYVGQVGSNVRDYPLVRAMLSKPEGLVTESALDGVRRIFGFVQLPETNARIAFGIDESEVLARANREMWTAFAELAIVAALVLLGIWFGGERLLVRPIKALAETASRIGHGDTKTHAGELPWATEFVPLAVALDDMAGKLDAREQELRDTNMQLRELAQVDALTGLANRRTFNSQLATEWQAAGKLSQPLAILMIDVDHFKQFNDHYGHAQGDNCLRKIGGILMEHTRSTSERAQSRKPDFAARYGGEEFAILLQGANATDALRVGERLRKAVENLLMAHAGAPWGFVSISIGVASWLPASHLSPQELMECADAALYEAKKLGRNRVAVHADVLLSQAS